MKPRLWLIGGGVRCGKSAFALRLGRTLGPRRAFVATAQPSDEEMRERARAHREERGGDFETYEEPHDVGELVGRLSEDVVVIDCVTLWISNLLLRGDSPPAILRRVSALCEILRERSGAAVLVTNEVGMGLVPETPLGRIFRDVTGAAHQALAETADHVYFGALGLLLQLKPSPLLVDPADARC